MANTSQPWEDYAAPAPQAGPWLDYQKAAPRAAAPQPEQAPWLDYQKAAPPKLTGTTYEGRPVVQYPDGSWAHEKSISIEADGRHMNIPTLFGGKEYTPDQAVEIMRKNKWIDPDTGKPVPTFKSEEEAVAAAQAKEAYQQTVTPGQAPTAQESTFKKLAVGGAQGLDVLRQAFTPENRAASKALSDAPKESERLGKMFEDVLQPLGPGPAEGLGKGLGTAAAAARATFGQLSAVIPKGLNDAVGTGARWLSENVTAPALKSMVPRYTWDEKQGKPVKDTSVTAMDKLIDEIAPDISMMTLFHAGGRLMDPNAAPLLDRSKPATMAPEATPLPQQPQTPPPATAIPAAAGRAGATPAAAPPISIAERSAQLEADNARIRAQLAQQAQPETQAAPAQVAPTDVAQPVTAQPPPVPPAPAKTLVTWDEHLTELKAVERGDKPAFYSAVEDPEALKYAEQSKNLKVYKNVTPDGDFIAAPKTAEGEATAQKLIDLSKQRKGIFSKARDAEDPRLEDWNKKFSETLGYEPELAESIQGISGRGPDELETERLMKYKAQEQAALTKTAEPEAEAPQAMTQAQALEITNKVNRGEPVDKATIQTALDTLKQRRAALDTPESRAAHAKVASFAAETVARMPEETKGMTPEQKTAWLDDQLIRAASDRVETERAAAGEAQRAEMQRGSITVPQARGIGSWLDRSLNAKDLASDIIREQGGEKAAAYEQARYALRAEEKRWNGASIQDSLNFVDAFETGNFGNVRPEDQPIARTLRDRFDQVRTDIQNLGTGKLENFYDNYYRHLFEQPGGIERLKSMIFGKRPLEGAAGGLKYRAVPLMKDAVNWKIFSQQGDFMRAFPDEMTARAAASLVPDAQVVEPWKPVTWNPVTNFLLHLGEMQKYVAAHKIKDNMIDRGTAAFVRFGQKPPEDWRPLDDKIFRVLQYSPEEKGFVIRGQYYAPADAAKAFNNYLSPGLKGNWAFDAMRAAGNTLNHAQLGLSFFHGGFTTLETGVGDLSLAIQKFSRGDVLGSSRAALRSLSFYSWLDSPTTGYRMLRNYLDPGSYPEYDRAVDLMKSAGGRPFQNEEFTNQAIRALQKGWQEKDAVLMARKVFPAALEFAAKPIMEKLVPLQKLGAFAKLADDIVERADREGWDQDTIRHEGSKAWDTIDDRLGQMVYDNIMVNKVVKDLAFVGVRSVGWNFGSVRQFGAGIGVDLPRELLRAATGRGFEVTPRMAYALALPIYMGWVGFVAKLALTGSPPQSVMDLYHPPTGNTDASGKPERLNLPSYMKDVEPLARDITSPGRFVKTAGVMATNKLNPVLSGMFQMFRNKDYNDTQIIDYEAPAQQQILQAAEFVAKQFLPFSVRAAMQRAMTSGQATGADVLSQVAGAAKPASLGATALSMVGVQPAPPSATGTPAERLVSEYSQMRLPRETSQVQRQQSLEARQLMQRFKTGQAGMSDVQQAIAAGKLTREHFDRMLANEKLPYLVRGIRNFHLDEALNVWRAADDYEKAQIKDAVLSKEHLLSNYPLENRQQMSRQLQEIRRYRPMVSMARRAGNQ